MSRCLRSVLPLLLLSTIAHPIGAQTRAENDSAAAKAVKDKSLPLITTRTLEFTTSEGSWISLDLSPDYLGTVGNFLGGPAQAAHSPDR